MSRSPAASARRWPDHVVWALVVATPLALVLIGAVTTELGPGECSGIGFGCTLAGTDLAGFLAILLVPPAVVIQLIGHGLILWLQRRRAPRG